MKLSATAHRIAVAAAPLVLGLSGTLLQALTVHQFDPWLIGISALTGLTTTYLNIVRAGSPAATLPAAKP